MRFGQAHFCHILRQPTGASDSHCGLHGHNYLTLVVSSQYHLMSCARGKEQPKMLPGEAKAAGIPAAVVES